MENMGKLGKRQSKILPQKQKEKFWKDRPVLVTGGAGFIGSRLVEALVERGARVYILDKSPHLPVGYWTPREGFEGSLHPYGKTAGYSGRWGDKKDPFPKEKYYQAVGSRAKYIQGDVRDGKTLKDLLLRNNILTIFHLAAEAIVGNALANPTEALDTNIRGTWTVLEAVRQVNNKIQVITASSDKAYGAHPKLPYTENFSLQGRNPYDCSKSCADLIAQMYAETYHIPVCITRCGNVYGEGDLNFSRLIPDTIRSLFYRERPQIRSNGLYRRDFIFISDIVSAYIAAAEALISGKIQNGVFNFGTGIPHRVIDVVNKITELMRVSLKPVILSRARHEIEDQYLDVAKAQDILDWHSQTGLAEGLVRTVSWYKDFLERRDADTS